MALMKMPTYVGGGEGGTFHADKTQTLGTITTQGGSFVDNNNDAIMRGNFEKTTTQTSYPVGISAGTDRMFYIFNTSPNGSKIGFGTSTDDIGIFIPKGTTVTTLQGDGAFNLTFFKTL